MRCDLVSSYHKSDTTIAVAILDFEAALWCAIREVISDVGTRARGCHFHWSQAIWCNWVLAVVCMEYTKTHTFIQRLLCLPFLPGRTSPTCI